MDILTVSETTWRGVAAWRVEASRLVLIVTRVGGHLAALWDRSDGVNPFWQPPWEPGDPAAVKPDGLYGNGPEARLLATIVGHNLCCDRFGAPWPGEQRPLHGESGIVAWELASGIPTRCIWTAWLPETRLHLRKTITVTGGTVTMSHAVSHDDADAREIEWCEHVNVGDPFLEGAKFGAGVDRVLNWPHEPEPGSRFADIPAEGEVPIAKALAMPSSTTEANGDVLCARLVSGWWMAENTAFKRRLTYVWDETEYPWLAIWTQNRSRTGTPWNGRTRSRGMEFSTKPWPEGKPPASRAQTYLGRPTTCVVKPGAWKEHTMVIHWERIF